MRTTAHKALAGLIAGTTAALGSNLLDGQLTWGELVASLGAGLVTSAAVWRVPNRQKLPKSGAAGLATSAIFETPRDS